MAPSPWMEPSLPDPLSRFHCLCLSVPIYGLIGERETVLHRPGQQHRDARRDVGKARHPCLAGFCGCQRPGRWRFEPARPGFVPEADYARACQLFYAEREDEL